MTLKIIVEFHLKYNIKVYQFWKSQNELYTMFDHELASKYLKIFLQYLWNVDLQIFSLPTVFVIHINALILVKVFSLDND